MKNIQNLTKKVTKCTFQRRSRHLSKKCFEELFIFFISNNKRATEDDKQGFSYGLKNRRSPAQVKDLSQFEDHLVTIVNELKFRNAVWRYGKLQKSKKTNNGTKINKEGIRFVKQADMLHKIGRGCSFVPSKDQKENFMNHPTARLINPSKNEIRRISKHILDQIKTKLVSEFSVNYSKNMISAINWLKNINDKGLSKFLKFDIKSFCPYI